MTCQGKRTPKADFHCRITNENYDFLYRVARSRDMSLAAAVNHVLSHLREQSGTTICQTREIEINMREANYAR